MKEYRASSIRNIGLVGHGSEGKTTLTEAMLYSIGQIDRMGRVEDGNTTTDFDAEEIKRGISISLALAPIEYNDNKINLVDIPGYFDLVGEMASGLRVVESALIVLGSTSGLEVGAEKAWDYCDKYNIARMLYVNAMDKENANFDKIITQLQDAYGTSIAPIQLPIKDGHDFIGYIDLVDSQAYSFDDKEVKKIDIPSEYESRVEELYEVLVEAAASADEDLMEKYFEEMELSKEEIIQGLKIGIKNGSVVPVLCGSALEHKNIFPLMDAINDLMPSPLDANPVEALDLKSNEDIEINISEDGASTLFVFKTIADNFVGKINFFKVVQGTLSTDGVLYNSTTQKPEKLHNISTMQGKHQMPLTKIYAGDIGALAKLNNTNTNDTLYDNANPVKIKEIQFPVPSISYAVVATKQGDEDKLFSGLHRLEEEDPSFTVKKSRETSDTLISGQGALHVNIITSKLENKFHVKAQLNDPQIAYRETIKKKVRAQGRHKKQSGGHGQYGDVFIEFEPIVGGSGEFEFVDKVVGGVVPRNYIPAVEKGLNECLPKGALAGYPVVNLRCTLYDGSYHSVDSSEMAFKIAAHIAFKKGCLDAAPVLLEPICLAKITIPDDYMGDIIGDINRRRGRIMGMNPAQKGLQVLEAEVPQTEMFKYATDLRSITGARGSFVMEFTRYDEVPSHIAQKVIEEAKKRAEEE